MERHVLFLKMLRLRYTLFLIISIVITSYSIFHFTVSEGSTFVDNSTKTRIQLPGGRVASSEDFHEPESTSNRLFGIGRKLPSWRPWRSLSSPYEPQRPPNNEKDLPQSTVFVDDISNAHSAEEVKDVPQAMKLISTARIAKCTIVFGDLNPVYERALQTHEVHNEKHGYPMYILRQSILDDVWTKPAYILSLILRELAKPAGERLEWLFWVDADTIMLNTHIPIEAFLPPSRDWDNINLMISHDLNGLNNGVFPIRVDPWSAELLSAIVAFRHYRPKEELIFRDQSAMSYLLEDRKFSTRTLIVPQRWFNAYQGEHNETLAPFQVRRGDFLVHFAGVPDRDNRMRYWLDRAEKHSPDWEIEIQHTSFPEEIRDFWASLAVERDANQQALYALTENITIYMQQTEQWLDTYIDLISEAERREIDEQKDRLNQIMVNEETKMSISAINNALEDFKNVSKET